LLYSEKQILISDRVSDCCFWLEWDAGGVLVWCTRCCRGGETVFFAGTGEEKWDKGIPYGFGWTDCERSVWVWVFQVCPLPLFIEGGEGA
jgi:hypothetical protein